VCFCYCKNSVIQANISHQLSVTTTVYSRCAHRSQSFV
jgi:hypothetical protein